MSSLPIVVIGAGGHARVVIDALQCAGLDVEGVAGPVPVADVLGVPYLGKDDFVLARKRESVRLANGKPQVLDGPYADTKEQLGGYYLIDAPNLDAAISWASRCPGAGHGVVEVRPVYEM